MRLFVDHLLNKLDSLCYFHVLLCEQRRHHNRNNVGYISKCRLIILYIGYINQIPLMN